MFSLDVLIVGAGPVGLNMALWLHRLGVKKIRIIDRAKTARLETRAAGVHARTLELYEQIGIAKAVASAGLTASCMTLWADGTRRLQLSMDGFAEHITPYPHILCLPQCKHETILNRSLAERGIQVELGCELLDLKEDQGGVNVTLLKDEVIEMIRVRYLAGCDGVRSSVRKFIGLTFLGKTYPQELCVMDVQAKGAVLDGGAHINLSDCNSVGAFPLPLWSKSNLRIFGSFMPPLDLKPQDSRTDEGNRAFLMDAEDVSALIAKACKSQFCTEIVSVQWRSQFRTHCRIASPKFTSATGRVFLVGDAAHVHSPFRGQGLNTGVGDAANLSWKLAAAIRLAGKQTDRSAAAFNLLSTYDEERYPVAQEVLKWTDRGFLGVVEQNAFARWARKLTIPLLAYGSGFQIFRYFQRADFMRLSQCAVSYRESSMSKFGAPRPSIFSVLILPIRKLALFFLWLISKLCAVTYEVARNNLEDTAASIRIFARTYRPRIRPGDRLPWTGSNFTGFCGWQIHVYGSRRTSQALEDFCAKYGVKLFREFYLNEQRGAGLKRDHYYLVRPDLYVALIIGPHEAAVDRIENFFNFFGIS